MTKYVYLFTEGNADMRNLLGGKGANLAEMTNIGLPVPRGFTVTTEACTAYYDAGQKISKDIIDEIYGKLEELEKITGKKMGDAKDLIKRITGRDIDIDQIKTIAEDAFNDIQSKMENGTEPATSSGNSLVDLYVVKIDHDVFYETCYEGMDYQVGLTLNLDYHSDLMS